MRPAVSHLNHWRYLNSNVAITRKGLVRPRKFFAAIKRLIENTHPFSDCQTRRQRPGTDCPTFASSTLLLLRGLSDLRETECLRYHHRRAINAASRAGPQD